MHSSFRRIHAIVRRARILGILLIGLFLLLLLFARGTSFHATFNSPEVKFTDASAGGLQIVPASCPSSPDYPGQCDPTPLCQDGSTAPNGDTNQCSCAHGNTAACSSTPPPLCSDGQQAPGGDISQCAHPSMHMEVDGTKSISVQPGQTFYLTWAAAHVDNCVPVMLGNADSWWQNGGGVGSASSMPTVMGDAANYTASPAHHALATEGTYVYGMNCQSSLSLIPRMLITLSGTAIALASSINDSVTVVVGCPAGQFNNNGQCTAILHCSDGSRAPNNDLSQCPQGITINYCPNGSVAPGNDTSNCPGGPTGSPPGCNGASCIAPGTGCVMGASAYQVLAGQSVQIGWASGCSPTYGCSYLGAAVSASDASIDHGVGSVSPPTGGAFTLFPNNSAAYTMTVSYITHLFGILTIPAGSAQCKVGINVKHQLYCPDGSLAVNGSCPAQQCTDNSQDVCASDSSGYTHYLHDTFCSSTFVACPYAADGYGCVGTTGSVGCLSPAPPTGSISANPSLLRSTQTSVISWTTNDTRSCSVTGTNGNAWGGTSGSQISSPIGSQTIFSLDCVGVDASQSLHKSVTVSVIPVFQEK